MFHKSGNHYTWRKVTTTVHNIIVGKLWVDHHGEMDIKNHKTGDNCHLKYYPYSYFSREKPRKVGSLYSCGCKSLICVHDINFFQRLIVMYKTRKVEVIVLW